MIAVRNWLSSRLNRQTAEHSARTALAALVSLLVARACRLPEAYWAPVTTLVVTQSTLGAALTVSGQRLAGTALGAAMGTILAMKFGPTAVVFALGVLAAGLLCAVLGLDRSAYRFTGITIGIVMLVARTSPPWVIALHRFIEVSIGIVVGLGVIAFWRERPEAAGQAAER